MAESTDVGNEDRWYADRRARWKPEHIRVLLIAESAPDVGGLADRRFLYAEDLTPRDGLFREVVRALFDGPVLSSRPGGKLPWLAKLKDEGIFLIDLASEPVNAYSPSERAGALEGGVAATVRQATELAPDGVVLVKQNVFDMLHRPLIAAGLPLLHDESIPFPGSGQQKRFRERFTRALTSLR